MNYQSIFDHTWQLRNKGKMNEAVQLASEALKNAEEKNDLHGQALMLKIIAQVNHDNGQLGEALKTYKRIEPIYIQLDKKPQQMHVLRHIGSLFLEMGKAECAEKCLVQVVDHYEAHEVLALEKANALNAYGKSLQARDKSKEAAKQLNKAKAIYENLGINF